MTYTYDPSDLTGRTVSRARFELGDVLVDDEGEVCMRLSFETDWRDDGTQFNLNQRAERWLDLRKRLKAEADAVDILPTSGAVDDSMRNPEDGGHYFYGGMMQNPYVKPPIPFRGEKKC